MRKFMEAIEPIQRGKLYYHPRVIDPDTKQPLKVRVSAVRQGDVYYKFVYPDGSEDAKAKAYTPIEDFVARFKPA
jgi:hypothetical protein